MAEAGKTSDWKSSKLAQHATGEALGVLSRGLHADHRNGLVTKGEPENSPKVSRLDPAVRPTAAVIDDCGDSTHWLKYEKKSGELADDGPGGRRAIRAEVKKQSDGTWKVATFAVWEVGSC